MSSDRVRRLGRGLDALLAPTSGAARADLKFPTKADTPAAPGFQTIAVKLITPNPLQPRREFDEGELAELRSSIRSNGLLQPLLVRPVGASYEIVAGERRFRAIQSLGWREVPVHVRELDDQAVLTLALIENLQRSDLNPIEEAEGYQALVTRFSLTQQQVADAVGRERSTVANMLRLLALPQTVLTLVRTGAVSLGHARALLGLSDSSAMAALAAAIATDGMTVREVERRVRESGSIKTRVRAKKDAGAPERPAEARGIEEQLRRKFQTDVSVTVSAAGRGDVRLSFYSADDLERMLDLLLGPTREVL
ncbi:MAG: ParB/RepB/Spo0J family partition protein [Gemmatimonadetes bacterium]|nr:ParB/RepB/Spo0J family partition protein [Gemmatimonadota bacterium]